MFQIWVVWRVSPDFPLGFLKQCLSLVSGMGPGIVMQEDETITNVPGRLRLMASHNCVKVAQARPLT